MRVSLNWLTDYVEIPISAKELGGVLTRIGFNCEEIIETATDVVLDLEITSNRPDMLGHIGVGREVAGGIGSEFHPPRIENPPTSGKIEDFTSVKVPAPDLCPRYTARVIANVKVGPSPNWLVERLEAIGQRSINNIVDITNYVLFEYSQPLHAFDYDKLDEHRIVVRRAKGGEQLVSIDETRCRLDENMLVIADANKAVAIAGIMGGLDTEVTEDTRNVLIESAQFDPLSIRMTSRKLALMSESNYRFERGVDPVAVDTASLRACQLILDLCGGELAEGVADVWGEPFTSPEVVLRPYRCNALLGIDIPSDRQLRILGNLQLSPKLDDNKITCAIPSWRPDLRREADLIEEIARLEGYDNIGIDEKVTHTVVPVSRTEKARGELTEIMKAGGYDETITFAFLDDGEAELFGVPEPTRVDPTVRKSNNVLRMTLIPSLLRVCKTNQDVGNHDLRCYELGAVFPPPQTSHALPREYTQLGMVSTGLLRELRGVLEAVAGRIAAEGKLDFRPKHVAGLAPEGSAEILLDGEHLGIIGPIGEQVRDFYDLSHTVGVGTVNFEMLIDRMQTERKYEPIPKFPSVQRDLSLIVDEEVTWGQLIETVESVDQPMRCAVDYVTTYRRDPIPSSRKSMTMTVTYRADQRTLRSEEVNEQIDQLVRTMKEKLNAQLRV